MSFKMNEGGVCSAPEVVNLLKYRSDLMLCLPKPLFFEKKSFVGYPCGRLAIVEDIKKRKIKKHSLDPITKTVE